MRLDNIISISDDTLGGTPVFTGTRVPIESLFQHLESGISLDEFLDDFPSVSKDKAVALIHFANGFILSVLPTLFKDENTDRRKSA